MTLAVGLPLHTLAKQLIDRELGAVDPSFLFAWPLARLLAVFFLDAAHRQEEWVDVSTPAAWAAVAAAVRARRSADGNR